MSQEQVSEDFNWVSAQAKCSATAMYERLRTRVKEDVQHRNGVFDRGDGWTFEFFEDDEGFEVSRLVAFGRSDPKVTALVRFERTGPRIHVHGEDVDVEFTTVVTLDHTGACRFVVGEAVYTDWEIRKMALEQLFFEEVGEDSE